MKTMQCGAQLTMSVVRENFWIPSLKRKVKGLINSCITCFRQRAKLSKQLMGQLPVSRVQPSFAFINVGVDYAGPITIKYGNPRSNVKTKAYFAVFICLATKAVHVEIVSSLSSQSFMSAFNRFVSRRWIPSIVYSDNGTNFQGAQKDISNLLSSNNFQEEVIDHASSRFIEWNFIPPHSPHFGGLWEAGIKSLKHHLKRTMTGQVFTFEELSTLTTQIETILNSHPICRLDDSHELNYLTAGHFLIGRSFISFPILNFIDTPTNRLNRWQRLTKVLALIWKGWYDDYLQTLQRRHKWNNICPNLNIGDKVLIKDDLAPSLQWKLGKITWLFPGPDGRVRVVTVKTSRGEFKRTIHKLAKLPINDDLPSVS